MAGTPLFTTHHLPLTTHAFPSPIASGVFQGAALVVGAWRFCFYFRASLPVDSAPNTLSPEPYTLS
jgi:hypothetical protein